MNLSEYNFTWGEQPEGIDPKYSGARDLPDFWKPMDTRVSVASMSYIAVSDCLSPDECAQFIRALDHIGYEDAEDITELGKRALAEAEFPIIWDPPKSIRTNRRQIWQVPREVTEAIFARIQDFLPREIRSGKLVYTLPDAGRINRRLRFFQTRAGQEFYEHLDASSSRVGANGVEHSLFSLVIWLNNEYTGGELAFGETLIRGTTGGAIVFPQSAHPNPARHRGMPVTTGVKYILRTDVFYSLPAVSG